MTPRFEVYKDRAGRWRWRLHDEHGATVAVGGAHDTETAARRESVEAKRAAEGALIEEVDVDPSTTQTTPAGDTASTTPTRWLVYKHPEEKPLVVVADGWSRTSDGALLRFVNHPPAGGGTEQVIAAFSASAVFGFVRDDAQARGQDRLLAFPADSSTDGQVLERIAASLLRQVQRTAGL